MILEYIEDKTYKIFKIESIQYVADNGGLKKVIEDMGYKFKNCYNRKSLAASLTMLWADKKDIEKYKLLLSKFTENE